MIRVITCETYWRIPSQLTPCSCQLTLYYGAGVFADDSIRKYDTVYRITDGYLSLSYGITKSAVCSFAKTLVKEFDGMDTTVNTIIPGFVATPWQNKNPEETKQIIYDKTSIRRFATVDVIVDAFRFCIDNPFVNGSLIEVDGGYCC